jgi:hypothetical protein
MSDVIAENGSWEEDFKKQETESAVQDKRAEWIKFDKPGQYRVRLCGNFVRFYRWWAPFSSRIITHLSYKDKDPAWNAGFWPRKTFAIHIIDRSDVDKEYPTGKLKILEKGSSIFDAFANYFKINNSNPAGETGPDFVIEVEWPNGNKRQANYKVTPVMKLNKWTDQEIQMIKSDHVDLKKMYAPTPLEDIISAWEGLPEESKIPPKREDDSKGSGNTQQQAQEVAVNAPEQKIEEPEVAVSSTEDDDLFGDDDSTSF